MSQTDDVVVRREVTVDAPIERAFAVFTERFGDFKPKEHNMLGVADRRDHASSRTSAATSSTAAEDGSECRWARVLAYEPPNRVVFSWDISPYWQIEADEAKTSEVEVSFVAETPDADAAGARAPQPRPARPRLGRRRATASATTKAGRCTSPASLEALLAQYRRRRDTRRVAPRGVPSRRRSHRRGAAPPMGVTIDDARAIAATLPRSYEALVRDRVKFRVGQIVYAAFSDDDTIMGFGFPREEREALVASEPDKFLMPSPSDMRYRWVQVRLDAIEVDELRELLVDAWRMCVPKKVAAAYEG